MSLSAIVVLIAVLALAVALFSIFIRPKQPVVNIHVREGVTGRELYKAHCFVTDDGTIAFRDDGNVVLVLDEAVRGETFRPMAGQSVVLLILDS